MPIMQQTNVAVLAEADWVVVIFGNLKIRLPYADALTVSHWLVICAKQAKRMAGDNSHTINPLAYLTLMRDGKVIEAQTQIGRDADVVSKNKCSVEVVGHGVRLHVGSVAIGMLYQEAATLAHWMRMRAKECKAYAGDGRHWSVIGKEHDLQHGPGVTRG
jgi:hypothetical protein